MPKNKNNYIFITAIILVILCIAFITIIMRGSELLGIFITAVVVLGLLILFSRFSDKGLKEILFIAIFLRVFLLFFQAYIAPLPDSGADATTFESVGWQALQAWIHGEEVRSLSGAYFYSAVIGIIYFIFGRIEILAQLLNVVLGVFIVYVIYKTAFEITSSLRAATIAGLLAAVFPTLNLYSAITMRENLIVFFIVISFYFFMKWLENGNIENVFIAGAGILLASQLHGAIILLGLAYALIFFLYDPIQKKWFVVNRSKVLIAGTVVAGSIIFGGYFLYKLPGDLTLLLSPEYLGERVASAARDTGAYLTGFLPQTHLDLIIQTPVRITYFLFSPFPWMITEAQHFLGLIDGFLYLILGVYTIKTLAILKRDNPPVFWVTLLVLIIFLMVFAWGTSNFGTAIRHRQKISWLLIILAAVSMNKSPWWKKLFNRETKEIKI